MTAAGGPYDLHPGTTAPAKLVMAENLLDIRVPLSPGTSGLPQLADLLAGIVPEKLVTRHGSLVISHGEALSRVELTAAGLRRTSITGGQLEVTEELWRTIRGWERHHGVVTVTDC